LSRQIHEDYTPAEPAEWQNARNGEERSNGAAGDGRGGVRRRPRSRTAIYVAVIVGLAILGGGAYAAYVENWIDFSWIGISASMPGGGAATRPSGSLVTGDLVFSGNAGDLAAPSGNLVQQDKSNPSVTWIRSSLRQANPAGTTDAASLQIKPPLVTDLVGKHIRVTVSARAPDQGSPAPFAVAFSSAKVGTSGWVVFTPTKEFNDYSFDYQVPATVGEAQHVGIWSDISGRGAPLAVRAITITKIN
jgi:hypothetical protein